MDTLDLHVYIEIDILGLAILMIIYLFRMYMHVNEESYKQKIFTSLICINSAVLVSDALSWWADGGNTFMLISAHVLLMCYYIGIVFMCVFWLMYCDFQLIEKRNRKMRFIVYFSPAILFSVVLLLSIKFGWIYIYDNQNIYHRGEYHYLYTILVGAYIISSLILVLFKAKRKNGVYRQDAYMLMLFALPPVVCLILQMIFYEMSLIPVSTALGLLIVFISRQSELVTLDSLTNLNNRRAFERFLGQAIGFQEIGQNLYLVFIDLDDFKSINDTYGHQVGDIALKEAAKVFQSICIKGDFLARLGGDEFVMVVKRKSTEEVEKIYELIHESLKTNSNDYGYKLTCSMGYVKYNATKHSSIDEFIKDVDAKMYLEKKQKTKEQLN